MYFSLLANQPKQFILSMLGGFSTLSKVFLLEGGHHIGFAFSLALLTTVPFDMVVLCPDNLAFMWILCSAQEKVSWDIIVRYHLDRHVWHSFSQQLHFYPKIQLNISYFREHALLTRKLGVRRNGAREYHPFYNIDFLVILCEIAHHSLRGMGYLMFYSGQKDVPHILFLFLFIFILCNLCCML